MKKDKNNILIIVEENKYFPSQLKGEEVVKKETEVNLDELFREGDFFSKCERRCTSAEEVKEVIKNSGWVIYCKK